MPTLSELLVEVGVDADDLTAGTGDAAAEVERALDGIADAAEQAGRDIADATGRAGSELGGVGDAAEQAARDVADAAGDAARALDEVGDSAAQAAQDADQAAQDTGTSLRDIAAGAAGAAVGAAFMTGLTSAMDMKGATAKLTAQLDLTAEEAEKAGDIAGDVYVAGWGESMDEVSSAVGAVASQLGGIGAVGEEELGRLTKQALALSEVFEFDVNEATQAVGTLLKTGLAKDGAQAMDLLAATAQKLPPALREELPVLTREYGEFFDQLGFTGPEMMGMLTEAAKSPTFEIDKMGDALKEFTLLMADTDAVKDPLKELGLNVKQIQKLMNTGQGTEAFDMVITALRGVEDQTKRTSLQAALFGGPGEDMGNALLTLKATGADAAAGLDQAAGSAQKITATMEESKTLDSAWRDLSTTLGELFLPYLIQLSEWVSENPALVEALVVGMLSFAVALGIVTAATWLWNLALLASPVTWIILGIIALIAVIALIIVKWDEVSAATSRVWDEITETLGEAWDWCADAAADWWHNTTEPWISGWDWLYRNVFGPIGRFFTETLPRWFNDGTAAVEKTWDDTLNWFGALPGRLASIGSGLWSWITDGLKDALNGAIYLINMGIWSINNSLISQVNRLPGVDIGYIPYIPMLASGGVTTGPTLAMIGEGAEQEAVLPLSVLDNMLRSVAGPVVQVGSSPQEQRLVIDVRGGEDEFVRFFRAVVDTKAAGSVVRLGEG
ncbi:phage tail tape measure protein [Streptomyces sp. NPDC057325]|uniref:phage tail tape measure protein n=1 Tax=unclassified Streptomyces TaxID=2593676 RepID=UPI0036275F95